jgi:DNA end-binding protein Ku
LGKIAFGGREHLVAISAPSDGSQLGMMAYAMRYEEELRNPSEYFGGIKEVAVDPDQLSLAKELIQRKASAFKPEKFSDEYETAIRAMIEAKVKHLPVPLDAPVAKQANVVNLMDALRKSVQEEKQPKALALKVSGGKPSGAGDPKRALTLVDPGAAKRGKAKAASKRKSA